MATRFKTFTTGNIKEALDTYASLCREYEDVRLEQLSLYNINTYIISYRFERVGE